MGKWDPTKAAQPQLSSYTKKTRKKNQQTTKNQKKPPPKREKAKKVLTGTEVAWLASIQPNSDQQKKD